MASKKKKTVPDSATVGQSDRPAQVSESGSIPQPGLLHLTLPLAISLEANPLISQCPFSSRPVRHSFQWFKPTYILCNLARNTHRDTHTNVRFAGI
jgi:hypothetical protein